MHLTKNQKRALKAIYRHYPHPFNADDLIDYDNSTSTMRRTAEGHRLSLTKRPLLLDLHQIADRCFSASPEEMKTTWDSMEELIAHGLVRRIPDLNRKRARLGYQNEPLPENTDETVWLYQATQSGIDLATYWRSRAWKAAVWAFTTFATASGITLILKLLGAKL